MECRGANVATEVLELEQLLAGKKITFRAGTGQLK